MNSLLDQYLLFRIRTKRDAQAFARLYDRYVNAIYRFVFLKLPSKEAAEDVTSETFLRAWQYLVQTDNVGNFRALLYRIARNLVADAYRKTESGPVSLVTLSLTETSSSSEHEPPDLRSAPAVVEARAEVTLILDKVSKLKEDFRDVVTLRLMDGLSFGEIAEILEKSPGNVRVIYHRAMKALQALL